jgi:hypothetical protein
MNDLLPSFYDELMKIAKAKAQAKAKYSGDEFADIDAFGDMMEQTTRTQTRGPHPALNLEASKT